MQAFMMAVSHWPANACIACKALQDMQLTHVVQLLPVTDTRGEVIHLKDYKRNVRGSIAVIWMSVSKQRPESQERFHTKIEMMRILLHPDGMRQMGIME
jgi:hypothetical protein